MKKKSNPPPPPTPQKNKNYFLLNVVGKIWWYIIFEIVYIMTCKILSQILLKILCKTIYPISIQIIFHIHKNFMMSDYDP